MQSNTRVDAAVTQAATFLVHNYTQITCLWCAVTATERSPYREKVELDAQNDWAHRWTSLSAQAETVKVTIIHNMQDDLRIVACVLSMTAWLGSGVKWCSCALVAGIYRKTVYACLYRTHQSCCLHTITFLAPWSSYGGLSLLLHGMRRTQMTPWVE